MIKRVLTCLLVACTRSTAFWNAPVCMGSGHACSKNCFTCVVCVWVCVCALLVTVSCVYKRSYLKRGFFWTQIHPILFHSCAKNCCTYIHVYVCIICHCAMLYIGTGTYWLRFNQYIIGRTLACNTHMYAYTYKYMHVPIDSDLTNILLEERLPAICICMRILTNTCIYA